MSIILTCRTCGDAYPLPEGEKLHACPSCGTLNACPQAEGEALDKLKRATRLRLAKEYAEAEACYRHVLVEYDEHEALWGKLMCQYGVEFICEPSTGKRFPLVHIPRIRPMQEMSDFQQACEMAPEDVRRQYEKDAEYIDDAQAEIRLLAESCPPYDVFLCHKTTLNDGEAYTKDYVRAEELYTWLKGEGYRVFFAPKEMAAGIAGANYEAMIYHALHTAKVMLVVCSDPANIGATWVQSEWQRYLERVDAQQGRLVPLLYGGLTPSRLPREFTRRKLEAVTMESLGAQKTLMTLLQKCCGVRSADPARTETVSEGVVKAQPAPAPQPVQPKTAVPAPQPVQPKTDAPTPQPVQPKPVAPAPQPVQPKSVAPASQPVQPKTAVPAPQPVQPKSVAPAPQPVQPKTAAPAPQPVPQRSSRDYAPGRDFVLESVPGGCCITGYRGPGGKVCIPPRIGGVEVLEIDHDAFSFCTELTEVEIPESVVSIGSNAFEDCTSLTDAVLPDGVWNIEDSVFSGCISLKRVRLPKEAGSIGDSAFAGCSSLMDVTIPEDVESIGDEAFKGCSSLVAVNLPENLESIGSYAFDGCSSLKQVTIPRRVTNIDVCAFDNCGDLLLRVHALTAGYDYVLEYEHPFELVCDDDDRALQAAGYAPGSHFELRDEFGGCCIVRYTGPGGSVRIPPRINGMQVLGIDEEAFQCCSELKDVEIPESVTGIGYNAFEDCTSLVSAVISGNVTVIEDSLFLGCSSLTVVKLPESVESIGDNAFDGCSSLTEVNLPEKLESIGSYAFDGCRSLKTLTIPRGVESIGYGAFDACDGLTCLVHFLTPAYDFLKEYEISFELISDGSDQALQAAGYAPGSDFELMPVDGGCQIVSYTGDGGSVRIPPTISGVKVLEIAEEAFICDTSLTDVEIPDSVESIGYSAFEGCCDLKEAKLPARLTVIEDNLFMDCSSLRRVEIPDSVESIGDSAFAGCSSLKRLIIPKGVQEIGDYAFDNCDALTCYVHVLTPAYHYVQDNDVSFDLVSELRSDDESDAPEQPAAPVSAPAYVTESRFSTEETEGGIAITGYSGPGGEVMIPESIGGKRVVKIGTMAFPKTKGLTGVVLPPHVESIEHLAFFKCASLKSVTIPDGVTFISQLAFFGCSSLESITIPASVTEISGNPFHFCEALCHLSVDPGNRAYYALENVLLSRQNELICYPAGLKAERYAIPSNVTKLGTAAFIGCQSLVHVDIPAGVKTMGDDVFGGCKRLADITLPESVEYIGKSVFGIEHPIVRVRENSYAHQYMVSNGYAHRVIPAAPQSGFFSRLFGKK